jgi:hypothetical protein
VTKKLPSGERKGRCDEFGQNKCAVTGETWPWCWPLWPLPYASRCGAYCRLVESDEALRKETLRCLAEADHG